MMDTYFIIEDSTDTPVISREPLKKPLRLDRFHPLLW